MKNDQCIDLIEKDVYKRQHYDYPPYFQKNKHLAAANRSYSNTDFFL